MAAKKASKTTLKKTKAGPKVSVVAVTPFLWFEDQAEEAARFYVSLIKGSKIVSVSPMVVEFTLAGQSFLALNGGPHHKLTPAFSIMVNVKTQKQTDDLWNALTKGGEESRCGWLVDRFGLSWQIAPIRLHQLLGHKDPDVAERAMAAMLKMQKIDIAALDRAAKAK